MDMDLAENSAKNIVRSCTTCSKAKAKCVKQPGARICERCARLKKECFSKEPILRRKKPVKPTRTAQLEKLESKIEHLVNALQSNTNTQGYRSSEYSQLSPSVSQVSTYQGDKTQPNRTSEVLQSLCHDRSPEEQSPSDTPQVQRPGAMEAPPVTPKVEDTPTGVTADESEVLLDRYQRLMAAGNPFVVLPDSTTAEAMLERRPVLLRAICTVAMAPNLKRQQALVKELLRDIGVRILVNNEKSLDILQGIIVFVLWFYPHIFWTQQTTNLLHLAMAMANDLAIDRLTINTNFGQQTVKVLHGKAAATAAPSMEERRVLLGLFYVTSMLSASFRKMTAMSFTPYMDDCLEALETAREYDSDLFLVQMVRIQRTIESIHTTEPSSAPAKAHIKAFQHDIERLRTTDPCRDDNVFLCMEYLTADILMWEISLNALLDERKRPITNHIEDLYRLVAALKSFFDVYFTIPPAAYLLLPFSVFGQFAYAFICLTKLASLDVEGWDLRAFNEVCNFSNFIDEAAARYEETARTSIDGIPIENDAFTKWAARVRWMKQVYEAKFAEKDGEGSTASGAQQEEKSVEAQEEQQQQQQQSIQQPQQQQPTPPDDILSADIFTYWDDSFWQTFASEFDLGYTYPNAAGMDLPATIPPTAV